MVSYNTNPPPRMLSAYLQGCPDIDNLARGYCLTGMFIVWKDLEYVLYQSTHDISSDKITNFLIGFVSFRTWCSKGVEDVVQKSDCRSTRIFPTSCSYYFLKAQTTQGGLSLIALSLIALALRFPSSLELTSLQTCVNFVEDVIRFEAFLLGTSGDNLAGD